MKTLDSDRLEACFEAAIELNSQELPRYLNKLQEESPALCRELIALLACQQEADAFFEGSPVHRFGIGHDSPKEILPIPKRPFGSRSGNPQPDPPRNGEPLADNPKIADYTLLELIDSGGMGTVFKAQQEHPVKRVVALKIIREGKANDSNLARFYMERQTLARMNHDAIARVFDLGEAADGRPYLTMEFIEGSPITHFCDEHLLSIRERLELFLIVCDGVSHAHQKMIVHRDLKPSNILGKIQDDRPIAKIIDFGIARTREDRLDKISQTRAGMFLGSLPYASPEQMRGGTVIDARTDIYSLGVVLYELICGQWPFEPGDFQDTSLEKSLRIIQETEPPVPSRWLERSSKTLEQAARNRRTQPKELLKQLRGDLNWIAMRAMAKEADRRYETVAQFGEDIRAYLNGMPVKARPPSPIYLTRKFIARHRTAVIAAVMVIVTLVGGLTAATVGFVKANRATAKTLRVNASLQTVQRFIQNALTLPDSIQGGRDATILDALKANEEAFDNFLRDDPEQAVQSFVWIAKTLNSAGEYQTAEKYLRIAYETSKELRPEQDARTLENMDLLARSLSELSYFREAGPMLQEARNGLAAVLGEADPKTLSANIGLASYFNEYGRYREAEQLFGRTLDTLKTSLGNNDRSTLRCAMGLANSYSRQDKIGQALALYRETRAIQEQAFGPRDPDTLKTTHNLALCTLAAGEFSEAKTLFQQAYDGRAQFLAVDHPDTLASLEGLGWCLFRIGDLDQAEATTRQAWQESERVLGENNLKTLHAMSHLGQILVKKKSLDQAILIQEECVARFRRSRLEDHPDALSTFNNLGDTLIAAGYPGKAVPILQETLANKKKRFAPSSSRVLATVATLGEAFTAIGDYDEAACYFREGLDEISRGNPNEALFQCLYGHTLTLAGNYQEAEYRLLAGAAPLFERDHPYAGHAARFLSELYGLWPGPAL